MTYITVNALSLEDARLKAAEIFAVDPAEVDGAEFVREPHAPAPNAPSAPDAPVAEAEESPAQAPAAPPDPAAAAAPNAERPFRMSVRPDFWVDAARQWVQGLTQHFGMPIEVRAQDVGTQVFVRLTASDSSILIGKQGHTLEALQHIVTRALTIRWPRFPEVILDVEGYKEKKFLRLEQTAREVALRAVRNQKPQDMEPMTASERKYIHNALKTVRGIRTISHGREPERHIVIEPLEGARPEDIMIEKFYGGGHSGSRRPSHGGGGNRPHNRPPQNYSSGRPQGQGDSRQPRPEQAKREREPFKPETPAAERDGTAIHEGEDSLAWRPNFFQTPEEATGEAPKEKRQVGSNEPPPYSADLEEDLYT